MVFVERSKYRMPELRGGTWLNSPPITLADLKGRAVLLDFWDYTCINCIRTLPYLVEWNRRYEGLGLMVIGIHAPEFYFSRSVENVLRAMERFGINYPVVMDNEYKIWSAFANRCWPAKYLVDKDGYIRYFHFGEGSYAETEMAIQLLIKEINPGSLLPDLMKPIRDTDVPGIHCYRVTPELYFGYDRGVVGNPEGVKPGAPVEYKTPFELREERIYLGGRWLIAHEYAKPHLYGDHEEASVYLKYTASEVNLVINPNGERGFRVHIFQDEGYVPADSFGDDVQMGEDGSTYIVVGEPRMYNLVKNKEFGTHSLKLTTSSNACELYAFTFVSCAA